MLVINFRDGLLMNILALKGIVTPAFKLGVRVKILIGA
jgi:hypothetical protein